MYWLCLNRFQQTWVLVHRNCALHRTALQCVKMLITLLKSFEKSFKSYVYIGCTTLDICFYAYHKVGIYRMLYKQSNIYLIFLKLLTLICQKNTLLSILNLCLEDLCKKNYFG